MSDRKKLMRSPKYPVISLEEAIEKTRTVFQREKKSYTTPEVLLGHLGYKVNGTSARVISALKQYGLIDEENGKCHVSEAGFQILHLPEGSPDRLKLLRESVRKPHLFNDLLDTYPKDLPSDETLRTVLITEKEFNPDSTEKFIRVFKAGIDLAKLHSLEYNENDANIFDEADGEGMTETGHGVTITDNRTPDSPVARSAINPAVRQYAWELSIPRNVRAELRIFGTGLKKEDVERLKKYIELLEEALLDEEDIL